MKIRISFLLVMYVDKISLVINNYNIVFSQLGKTINFFFSAKTKLSDMSVLKNRRLLVVDNRGFHELTVCHAVLHILSTCLHRNVRYIIIF